MKHTHPIWKIGTRGSVLARWQSEEVRQALEAKGIPSEEIIITSEGDLKLDVPLYEMGITGIFTRTLDIALLNGEIDLAVHSLKDVPTKLPKGVVLAAVLPRGAYRDTLVLNMKRKVEFRPSDLPEGSIIATGSLRRRAQWLHRFPKHQLTGLRGNIQTRIKKLEESNWEGAIFAHAAIERLGLQDELFYHVLDWMLPAPSQGIVGIVCREEDTLLREQLIQISHPKTMAAATVERAFMRGLEGGCSAPIGALAMVKGDSFSLEGCLLSPDGTLKLVAEWYGQVKNAEQLGYAWAKQLLDKGGHEIMEELRNA
jgi:hydroxymethylbilane synthase